MYDRSPYTVAPYGEDQLPGSLGPSELFARSKYIFVYQDVRGRCMCEGTFEDMRPYIADKKSAKDMDETSDTYDTIDWLVKHVPNNNGKVGLWGISYPGFYTAAGMIDAHPALKAVSPQAPMTDWFIGDDFHHNGALLPAAHVQLLWPSSASRARADQEVDRAGFDHERPTATISSCGWVRSPTPTSSISRASRVLERDHEARHLRRFLEGPQPRAAHRRTSSRPC